MAEVAEKWRITKIVTVVSVKLVITTAAIDNDQLRKKLFTPNFIIRDKRVNIFQFQFKILKVF
ncbi:hypothetical protein AUK14_01315 [Candidatus Berkelbacteria bacterium CG2_30_39_44]|nr:MAG: hypothetical protein AUK14_01315 [Candidatus Berkelbacteria bacterium CG2_30_39_44]